MSGFSTPSPHELPGHVSSLKEKERRDPDEQAVTLETRADRIRKLLQDSPIALDHHSLPLGSISPSSERFRKRAKSATPSEEECVRSRVDKHGGSFEISPAQSSLQMPVDQSLLKAHDRGSRPTRLSLADNVFTPLNILAARNLESGQRSTSIFEMDVPGVHHHVHHHMHHHHHNTEDGQGPDGQAKDTVAIYHRAVKDSELEEEVVASPAAWEPNYPVLTPDFYDDTGRVKRQRKPSSEGIKTAAQAKQFFSVARVIARSFHSFIMEATVRTTGQRVAIKMISKKCDQQTRKQALMEQKVLSQHSRASSFVVQLHSAFQTTLHCYLVMEYLEGGSLEDRLSRVQVYPERVAVFYLAEISVGVFFLHQRGILHRDLRLRNIMLRHNGHVRIIDFGMCKQNMKNAFTNTMVGAFKEMPPEMHHNAYYNKAVDYWTMGLILFTLVHGEFPFKGKTGVDIFKSVTLEKEAYGEDLEEPTVALCKELLRKNQKKRLGYDEDSQEVFRMHPFFTDVVWDRLERRHYTPPFVPIEAEMAEDDVVAEMTWPDLSEQNLVFAGTGVPRRLSLAVSLHDRSSGASIDSNPFQFPAGRNYAGASKRSSLRGSAITLDKLSLTNSPRISPSPSKHRGSDEASLLDMRRNTEPPTRDQKRLSLGTARRGSRPSPTSSNLFDVIVEAQESAGKSISRTGLARSELLADRATMLPHDDRVSRASSVSEIRQSFSKPSYRFTCFRSIWASFINCCRVEGARCRALCCGLENVKPPVLVDPTAHARLSYVSLNNYAATESAEDGGANWTGSSQLTRPFEKVSDVPCEVQVLSASNSDAAVQVAKFLFESRRTDSETGRLTVPF